MLPALKARSYEQLLEPIDYIIDLISVEFLMSRNLKGVFQKPLKLV